MSDRAKPVVIGVGEVLWDMLPAGKQLGGAPANFAYHARALGADGFVVSCVGDDPLGHELLKWLSEAGLPQRYVAVDGRHPTGTVDVHLDADGKPYFVIHEDAAWDFLRPRAALDELFDVADVVCFGSLAQRSPVSRAAIRDLLAAVPDGCLCVFDVNLRQRFYNRDVILHGLQAAHVVKLNDEELPEIARLLKIAGDDTDTWMAGMQREFGLLLVALTRGAHGSVLLSTHGRSEHAGFPTNIVDTVGAGDAFTAAVALGVLRGLDLDAINACANRVASFVCGQSGAMPPLPAQLAAMFR